MKKSVRSFLVRWLVGSLIGTAFGLLVVLRTAPHAPLSKMLGWTWDYGLGLGLCYAVLVATFKWVRDGWNPPPK